MSELPTPSADNPASWVREHIGDLCRDPVAASPSIRGGQTAADAALAGFDVSGYARNRNEVWPVERRGASGLSPWIRHGLLTLPCVWDAVAGGPSRDVRKFRDELLWQEYARHVYARLGDALSQPLRGQPHEAERALAQPYEQAWDRSMRCMDVCMDELETHGWLVNQTRMWLASQWSVRHGAPWQSGERAMFRHLLDGSNAANGLGWQWTIGAGLTKRYGFSRWQVNKRASGLCDDCSHNNACPIEQWPQAGQESPPVESPDPRIRHDPDLAATTGPTAAPPPADPEAVWITIESLGDADPALTAHPDLPAVFVFDEALLGDWDWSAKRLVFVAECLADLARRRPVRVLRGNAAEVLAGSRLAATFSPVPEWTRLASQLDVVETHPWPWLAKPHDRSVQSFTAWRKTVERQGDVGGGR